MSWSLRLFLAIWSAVWTLGLPLILLYLAHRGRRDADYTRHLAERLGRHATGLPGAVWIHAVSLGELRSAVPLIRALLARGDRVVVTLFTPAGRREAEAVFAPDIAAGRLRAVWVPLETGWAFRGFLRAFRPAYGLVMEIEIWPRMVFAARQAGVPLFMCNAQYPQKSRIRDARGLRLRQQVMRGFAGAFVKSQVQADRFAAIGVANITVTGELRFDQPIPPALLAAGAALRPHLVQDGRPVIAFVSTVEGEDPVYLDAIATLRKGLQPPFIVYVPRAPERFGAVAGLLQSAGLAMQRRSGILPTPLAAGPMPDLTPLSDLTGADGLLGDSLGEMYFYLSLADIVVVGGGFTPHGAHNIIEPLALRKPVITGPEIGTIEFPFLEAEAAGVARRVPDAPHLAQALAAGNLPEGARIDAFFAAHSGSVAKVLAALPGALVQPRQSPVQTEAAIRSS